MTRAVLICCVVIFGSGVADCRPARAAGEDPDPETLSRFAEALADGSLSLEDVAREAAVDSGDPGRDAGAGSAVLRLGKTAAGMSGSLSARCEISGLLLKARRGLGPDADRPALSFSWTGGTWGGVAGGFGVEHGFGLLASAPGRWRSLSAGGSLGPARQGCDSYASGEDGKALLGAVALWRKGGWEAAAAMGDGDRRRPDPRRRGSRLIRVAWAGDQNGPGLAYLRETTETGSGSSLAVSVAGSGVSCDAEIASWRDAAAVAGARAWSVHACRRGRWGLCEGMLAGAGRGYSPPLGRLPAVLPGPGGRGWALRSRIRIARSTSACGLISSGNDRETGSDGSWERSRGRIEFAVETRPLPGLDVTARCRWDRVVDSGRDERMTWEPPRPRRRETGSRLVLRGEYGGDPGRARLTITTVGRSVDDAAAAAVEPTAPSSRRTVAEVRFDRPLGENLSLRLGSAWAWGDCVDLVTASAPAAGIVMPRHWGKWSAETAVGLDLRRGRGRFRLAVLQRRAVPDAGEASRIEFHLMLSSPFPLPL